MTQMERVNADDLVQDEPERFLYNGERFTGEAVETNEDGTIIGLNTYRNGYEEGPQREWYPDGSLRSEYWVINGRITGEAREWHDNGRLAKLQHWNEFGEMTAHEEWNENGEPDPI